jgi:hypothetical protein
VDSANFFIENVINKDENERGEKKVPSEKHVHIKHFRMCIVQKCTYTVLFSTLKSKKSQLSFNLLP